MLHDLPHLNFEQTVELLSDVLPARALQYVVSQISDEARERLASAGVNDQSIAAQLDAEGVPRYQIARQAVRDASASETSEGDVFGQVDRYFRDEQNPMITHVRALVEDVLNPS